MVNLFGSHQWFQLLNLVMISKQFRTFTIVTIPILPVLAGSPVATTQAVATQSATLDLQWDQ